jgi:hypothetical protein
MSPLVKTKRQSNFDGTYFPFFHGNFLINGYSFLMPLQLKKTLTESIKKL